MPRETVRFLIHGMWPYHFVVGGMSEAERKAVNGNGARAPATQEAVQQEKQ